MCVCVPPKPNAFYIYSKWKLTTEVIFLIAKANRSSARRQNGRALPWHSYLGYPSLLGKSPEERASGELEAPDRRQGWRAQGNCFLFKKWHRRPLSSVHHHLGFPGGSEVKNLPAMQETWVQSLGRDDPLEKEMATHSSILARRIPGTEEPGWL